MRDDRMRYIAYVPKGSIARGKLVASQGIDGLKSACDTCHSPQLGGVGPIPALAGRSPTYLLRALFEFQTGKRVNDAAELMKPIVAQLKLANMIDVTAYAASLPVRR